MSPNETGQSETEEGYTPRIIRLLEQRLAWEDGPPMGTKDREAIIGLLSDLKTMLRTEAAEPRDLATLSERTATDPERGTQWRFDGLAFQFKDSSCGDWIGTDPSPTVMRVTPERVKMWSSLMQADILPRAVELVRTGVHEGWDRGDLTNAEDLLAFWDRVYPNTGSEGAE